MGFDLLLAGGSIVNEFIWEILGVLGYKFVNGRQIEMRDNEAGGLTRM